MVFYAVFDEGFALLDTPEAVIGLLRKANNVEIKQMNYINGAYVLCCEKYVKRWVDAGNSTQPPLPRLEELINAGGVYVNPAMTNVWNRNCPIFHGDRSFAVVGWNGCVGVADIWSLDECLRQSCFQWVEVKEVSSPIVAAQLAVSMYQQRLMSIGAYLQEPVQAPVTLPINEIYLSMVSEPALQRTEGKMFLA